MRLLLGGILLGVTGGGQRFELTPSERFMVGTTFDNGTLVLRPTLPRRLLAVPLTVVGVVVASVLVIGSVDGDPKSTVVPVVAAVVIVAAAVSVTVAYWRSRVVATPEALVVVDRWRRTTWKWRDIERFAVADATPGEVRASPLWLLTWRLWPGESMPVAYLRDRSILRLWVLSSTVLRHGWSLGSPSPAEIHAGILARYHAVVCSCATSYVARPHIET